MQCNAVLQQAIDIYVINIDILSRGLKQSWQDWWESDTWTHWGRVTDIGISNTPIPHIRSSYRSEPFWANLRTAVSTDLTLGERPFFAILHSNNNLLTTVTIPQDSSTVQAPTM